MTLLAERPEDLPHLEIGPSPVSHRPDDDVRPGLRQVLLHGSAALSAATVLQRTLAFAGTALAARVGGATVFGAYSIGVSTAGLTASYLGLGLGATATRYMSQASHGTVAYRTTLLRLTGLASMSAIAAGLVLFVGAGPIAAHLLNDGTLAPLLRAAAASAVAFILFEALNGMAMGLLAFRTVLALSLFIGLGTVIVLPAAAHFGAPAMLIGQALAMLAAIGAAVMVSWRSLGFSNTGVADRGAAPPLRELLHFGFTQLGASAALAFASWWVAVLVVRYDPSLAESGYYFVGGQLRALAALAPTQVTTLVLPMLVRYAADRGDQRRVVLASTFAGVASSVLIGGVLLIVLPLVPMVYGSSFERAIVPAALLIATAVVHMAGAPVVNALLLAELRVFTAISMTGCAALVVLAVALVPRFGAAGAAAAWLLAHALSQPFANAALGRRGLLPAGVVRLWLAGSVTAVVLAAITCARSLAPSMAQPLLLAQMALLAGAAGGVVWVGSRLGFLPRAPLFGMFRRPS